MTPIAMQRNKRLLFIFASTLFIVLGISGGLLNVAWTYMKDTFQVEVGAIGVLLLFATSGSLAAAMLSGTLIGRFGIGRIALAGMLFVTIGFTAIAFTKVWGLLLLIIFITYMGRGALDAGMNNFVSENYGTSEMNWLHASWGVGLTIAPTIITFILLTLNLGWQGGYIFVACITGIMALIIFLNLRLWDSLSDERVLEDDSGVAIKREKPATIMEALQNPAILLTAALCFVYGGLEIGTGQLVNTLFVEGRLLSQEVASLFLSLYWGSFTVGRILMGWVALRVSDRNLLRGGTLMGLLGAMLLTMRIPFLSISGLILMGAGSAGVFPTLVSQTPLRVGRRFTGQTIGFMIGFSGLGGALVPGIIGFFAGRFSLEFITYGLVINALFVVIIYEVLRRRYPIKLA